MVVLKIIPFYNMGSFLSECRFGAVWYLGLYKHSEKHSPSQGAPVWVEDEMQRRYKQMGKHQVRLK